MAQAFCKCFVLMLFWAFMVNCSEEHDSRHDEKNEMVSVPAIAGSDIDGKVVSISDLGSKYLVLHLIDVDCNNCRNSYEEVNTIIANTKADLDIELLSVGIGLSKSEWAEFMKSNCKEGYCIYLDGDKASLTDSLQINSTPTSFLLGKKRKIKAGPFSDPDDLEDAIHDPLN